MKKGGLALFALFLSLITFAAFGQDFPVPDVDPLPALFELIKNWKTVGWLGAGMTLIVIAVQLLKTVGQNFKYSRFAVTVLSVLYAALVKYQEKLSIWDAIITTVIVGGGAVAIYEAWKGISKMLAPSEVPK